MKLSKKALTAMLAVSIAATALPAAAMVSNLTNILTSSNPAGTNNTAPQTTAPAAAPETSTQTGAPAGQAEPSPASMFTTEDVDGGVAITGFNTSDANFTRNVVIPPTIGGKTVVAFKSNNDSAYMDGADQVHSLDLSYCTSITIEDYAFYNSGSLAAVNLSSCTSIGNFAFAGTSIIKLTLPTNNSYTIGNSSFKDCNIQNGESVDFSRCTSIGDSAFYGNNNGLSPNLSNCLSIGNSAFYRADLYSIKLPNCISIGNSAFYQCPYLTSVVLSKCTSIGNSAFYYCLKLTSVTLPTQTLYTIGDSAFQNCTKITDVDLSNCTSIGDYAFYNCQNITGSINLSRNCTSIGSKAFNKCKGITGSVDLSQCTSIGNSAFWGCSGITGSIDLSNCISVEESTFSSCSKITSVTFPTDHPYTISNNAFDGCSSITGSMDLSNCTSIGSNAFSGCSSNLKPTISTNTTNIGSGAFPTLSTVTIMAQNETDLVDYSKTIDLSALSNTKNIGLFDLDSSQGSKISFNPDDLASTISAGGIYYVYSKFGAPILPDGSYNYRTVLNVQLAIKCISNGNSSYVSKTIPITLKIPENLYMEGVPYYLSVDASLSRDPLTFHEDNGWYTYSMTYTTPPTVAGSKYNIVIFYASAAKVEIFGEDTLTYGDISYTYSSKTTPALAIQDVTWSSNDEDVLKFENPTNGTATIVGTGTTTIKATSADKMTKVYAELKVTVNKAQPALELNDDSKSYTGQPIEIDEAVVTLANDGSYDGEQPTYTYYSDAECQNELEGAPTDAGTYYVKASVPEQNSYYTATSNIAKFTVEKAKPTVTLKDKNTPYTGQSIEIDEAVVTLENGESYTGEITYTYYSDVDCKNQLEGAPINAGTYYVKASIPEQDNYTAAESNVATLTITPIDMNSVTATSFNGSYDGQPHSISVTVTGQPEDANIKYYVGDYNTDQPEASEWKETPPEFTDVCNETISYKVTDPNGNYNEIKGIAILTITPVDVAAVPPAPEMESRTPDSITLKTVDGGTTKQGDAYSAQYGIDVDGEITWQDNATFTGLTPGDHNFYLRYHVNEPKTGNYTNDGCSAPSEAATFIVNQLDPPTVGEGFTIDYVNETISLGAGYEAATDANFAAENMLNSGDKIQPGSTVYVRTATTGDAIASVGTPNAIASRPATPTVPNVVQTVNMLTVTNPGDQQEYKFDKAVNATRTSTLGQWQSSPVFTDNNMVAGDTYTVTTRIKATETTFASEEATTGTTTEAFPEKQETLKGDTNEAGEFVWTGSDGNDYTGGYDIPTRLLTTGGDTYMVEIDWGDMLFSYNFGTWDTETLSYDDPSKQGWTTSFDGVNNEVTVINRSSNAIESTIGLTVDADKQAELEHLGFHLTSDNKNSEDSNDYYPTEAKTLQKGSTGNSTTAYVNIKSDDTKPNDSIANKYNKEVDGTQIGNITVTVQKTN